MGCLLVGMKKLSVTFLEEFVQQLALEQHLVQVL